MGRYSDDVDVEAALTALENEFNAAQEAYDADNSPANNAALRDAEVAYVTARQTSRGGRTVSIITE